MNRFAILSCLLILSAISVRADDLIVSELQFVTGIVEGDVIVEAGGVAVLDGATVQGNVVVGSGGALDSLGPSSVIVGNVQVDEADFVALLNELVAGDIRIKRSGDADGIGIFSCVVLGSIQLVENDATAIFVGFPGFSFGNLVFGDVQFFKNTAATMMFIADNEIDGDLLGGQNHPQPIVAGNRVSAR
ncbi:MAG: hypothetical protein MI861_28790 [Pirellulales bacterium]|nr:hypothetical protein [Pirellulales bacterium]